MAPHCPKQWFSILASITITWGALKRKKVQTPGHTPKSSKSQFWKEELQATKAENHCSKRPELLKLECAHEFLEDLIKTQVLTEQVWASA